VAVFAPLRQIYDYRFDGAQNGAVPAPGSRVWIPFGRAHRVAVVIAVRATTADDVRDLKDIAECLDPVPLLAPAMLELATWAASYYQHPIGDVIAAMLPTRLRQKRHVPTLTQEVWRLTPAGHTAFASNATQGERQREVMQHLAPVGSASANTFAEFSFGWRAVLRRLIAKGWVESLRLVAETSLEAAPVARAEVVLNPEQMAAAEMIDAYTDRFQPIVLHGVTGSGKTEVYLHAIERTLAAGRQALVLVPEIALTQQLVGRFRQRFGDAVALLHSALNERERVLTWDACRCGRAGILIGTRSAVWVGLPRLGLVVVDEEHDPSYKQQEGFRYSARDIAIVRARHDGVPVVLGSATPALETLANIERGKFVSATLRHRAQSAAMPEIHCVDVRGLQLEGGLGHILIGAMREHLGRGEQVMLYLNRRGYAPLLICRGCGELRRCDRCDAYLVYHKHANAARCHHCDRHRSLQWLARCCDAEEVAPIGLGTERLEEVVAETFPEHQVCRIDRDTVRRPGAFDAILRDVAEHRIDILIGTQMVAKGLDFADITLVGIVDADSRLYSVDFRAEERLAQLLIQVAGRAGRARKPGTVLVQTHHPEHPVLRRIISDGYEAYANAALIERREAGLPPFAAMAIVRAESPDAARPIEFLGQVRRLLLTTDEPVADISYPIPALMERRAGRYRALIVIRSANRTRIGRMFTAAVPEITSLASRHRVRWSLDIDPQDTL
jgi:primosomal protein N' (replication factor Y)